MLKASELRIGNLVDRENTGHSLEITALHLVNFDKMKSFLFPLKLREKQLLKFGFTNIDRSNIYVKLIHQIGETKLKSLAVYIDENNYTVAIVDYYTGVEKTDLLHFDYEFVHQLQNLYFALVGEELVLQD